MNKDTLIQELIESNVSGALFAAYRSLLNLPTEDSPQNRIQDHPRIIACKRLLDGDIDRLPFHGANSLEAINKIFSEHYLPASDEYYCKCNDHIENMKDSDQMSFGIGKVGKYLDDAKFGGSMMIRAACMARSRTKSQSTIRGEITEAIETFESVRDAKRPDDFFEIRRGKYVSTGKPIPGYYHLIALAYTDIWRDEGNLEIVNESFRKWLHMDLPQIYLLERSQLVAPASIVFCEWFNPSCELQYMRWFDIVRLLLKMGISNRKLTKNIKNTLNGFDADAIKKSTHFMSWGAYTGLALESDWRSKKRKHLDLLYRKLELQKYSGILEPTDCSRELKIGISGIT
ncbi:MAG: hypothetical protein GF315_13975 [candidate division Zixibacteria bacterium]|nr:hypothetical protein [candidate division Zixibacteria bacterium]